jgi:hypothetical protein
MSIPPDVDPKQSDRFATERGPDGHFKTAFMVQAEHAKRYQQAKLAGQPKLAQQYRDQYRERDWAIQGKGGLYGAIGRNDGAAVVKMTRNQNFNELADTAYNDPSGYSIGYVRGQKVMFVSGSRNTADWAYNFGEVFRKTRLPKRTSERLSKIAKRNNVKVVVGHSRGAKLVSAMRGPFRKAGLDGAMLLANRRDKKMLNLVQGSKYPPGLAPWGKHRYGKWQPLDSIIGFTGKNNYYVEDWTPKNAHFYYRDFKGYRPTIYRSPYRQVLGGMIYARRGKKWYDYKNWYKRPKKSYY